MDYKKAYKELNRARNQAHYAAGMAEMSLANWKLANRSITLAEAFGMVHRSIALANKTKFIRHDH